MKISNTLFNDTSTGEIAFAEQLKDRSIAWDDNTKDYNSTYIDGSGNTQPAISSSLKTEANKFQSALNALFLKHFADFQIFLHDKGVPGVIDTWRDVEEFLAGISDTEVTLMRIALGLQAETGMLNVRMSDSYPGMMEAVTLSDNFAMYSSSLDSETGALNLVYNFE